MLFRQITLFAAIAAVSCSGKKVEHRDDAALAVRPILLLDADGDAAAELYIDTDRADACRWSDRDQRGLVSRADGAVRMTIDTTTVAALTPGPAGRLLSDRTGADVARIVIDRGAAGRISALDNQGIALFRIAPDGAGATVLDRASRPVAVISPRDDLLVVKSRDDTITHYVTGTRDPALAALLATPELELRHRLLLACDRILGSNHDI